MEIKKKMEVRKKAISQTLEMHNKKGKKITDLGIKIPASKAILQTALSRSGCKESTKRKFKNFSLNKLISKTAEDRNDEQYSQGLKSKGIDFDFLSDFRSERSLSNTRKNPNEKNEKNFGKIFSEKKRKKNISLFSFRKRSSISLSIRDKTDPNYNLLLKSRLNRSAKRKNIENKNPL